MSEKHVQTIVHGDISPYYYRDCSCGWQGTPCDSIAEACEESCPYASDDGRGRDE